MMPRSVALFLWLAFCSLTPAPRLQVTMIKGYREKIETELAKICEDILDVLDKHLIPSAASGESKVFYHKM
jgi:hypothetical protein